MNDVLAEIRQVLAADAGVSALVGARIYAGRDVPPEGYLPSQGAAVTFRVRGGQVDSSDGLLRPSVQFKCYGQTEVTAQAVYRAVFAALHNVHSGTVRYGRNEFLGQTLQDGSTDWTFVLAFFEFLVAL